jgi:head-tail adaptor
MTPSLVGAGRRIHSLTITGPGTLVPDGMGGYTETPTIIADQVYGEIVPASARDLERILPAVVTASASHIVTIPYVPGIAVTSTVTFHDPLEGDRTFTINGIHDPDLRHWELVLACTEAL